MDAQRLAEQVAILSPRVDVNSSKDTTLAVILAVNCEPRLPGIARAPS